MKFTFNKMKQEDAHQIASWHYEAPYDFYDSSRPRRFSGSLPKDETSQAVQVGEQ